MVLMVQDPCCGGRHITCLPKYCPSYAPYTSLLSVILFALSQALRPNWCKSNDDDQLLGNAMGMGLPLEHALSAEFVRSWLKARQPHSPNLPRTPAPTSDVVNTHCINDANKQFALRLVRGIVWGESPNGKEAYPFLASSYRTALATIISEPRDTSRLTYEELMGLYGIGPKIISKVWNLMDRTSRARPSPPSESQPDHRETTQQSSEERKTARKKARVLQSARELQQRDTHRKELLVAAAKRVAMRNAFDDDQHGICAT